MDYVQGAVGWLDPAQSDRVTVVKMSAMNAPHRESAYDVAVGGAILHHLIDFLGRKSTTVIFVGWQGHGTMGRRLVDGAEKVRIHGQDVPVKANIKTLNGFSAHADQAALLDWAKHVPGPPKQWFANHGEEEAADQLAFELKKAGFENPVAVEPDQTFEI